METCTCVAGVNQQPWYPLDHHASPKNEASSPEISNCRLTHSSMFFLTSWQTLNFCDINIQILYKYFIILGSNFLSVQLKLIFQFFNKPWHVSWVILPHSSLQISFSSDIHFILLALLHHFKIRHNCFIVVKSSCCLTISF